MQEQTVDYYKIISANIKKLRLANKQSQERFAEIIGCSREYVSRLENNREKISLAMLIKISKIYNSKPQLFFNV